VIYSDIYNTGFIPMLHLNQYPTSNFYFLLYHCHTCVSVICLETW